MKNIYGQTFLELENYNVDDGEHAISFYKDLIEALDSK